MKKANVLTAFFGLVAFVSLVFAGSTTINILKLADNEIQDSSAVARINVGSTNAITGNLTVSGQALLATIVPGTTTPVSAGQLGIASNKLYIATGTLSSQWMVVGTQS
jgi:hypothetical protein